MIAHLIIKVYPINIPRKKELYIQVWQTSSLTSSRAAHHLMDIFQNQVEKKRMDVASL